MPRMIVTTKPILAWSLQCYLNKGLIMQNRIRSKMNALVMVVGFLTTIPALATTTFYTDQSAWSADVLNPKTDDFTSNGWSKDGTYLGTTTGSGDAFFQVPYNGGFYGNGNYSKMFGYGPTASLPFGRLYWHDFDGVIQPLTITLNKPTYAISFNLGELYGKNLTYQAILSQLGEQAVIAGKPNGYSFFGIVSTTPFDTLVLAATNRITNQPFNQDIQSPSRRAIDIFPTISNLTLAQPVPEPANFSLMLAGFVLLARNVKRKSSLT